MSSKDINNSSVDSNGSSQIRPGRYLIYKNFGNSTTYNRKFKKLKFTETVFRRYQTTNTAREYTRLRVPGFVV